MERDPILASVSYGENGEKYVLHIEGGLHYIKGNSAPYFSLVCSIVRIARNGRRVDVGGGADHDAILKHRPRFADLAALHLSDIDGAPMHAAENGWYWYIGGTQFGNQWLPAEVRYKQAATREERTGVLARHLRISESDAAVLMEQQLDRAAFSAFVETQRPRWKQEAQACVAKHSLKVYGDPWNGGPQP